MEKKFDEIVTHLITSGFVFQDSEIYGGLSNSWDFGPLGVELKNNIKKLWWEKFVRESPTNVGIDAAILMNPIQDIQMLKVYVIGYVEGLPKSLYFIS